MIDALWRQRLQRWRRIVGEQPEDVILDDGQAMAPRDLGDRLRGVRRTMSRSSDCAAWGQDRRSLASPLLRPLFEQIRDDAVGIGLDGPGLQAEMAQDRLYSGIGEGLDQNPVASVGRRSKKR